MINKLLCFMWGHQFDRRWYAGWRKLWLYGGVEYLAEFRACIHCGKIK